MYPSTPDYSRVDSCIADPEESPLPRLRRQLEYYLSDSNLANDPFLRNQVTNAGYFPLQPFLTFNKVANLLSSIPEKEHKLDSIRSSLKDSQLLKLSKNGTKVKRLKKFDLRGALKELDLRTLYLQGFGKRLNRVVFHAYLKRFGHIARLHMPAYLKGDNNKGFAFVTFSEVESAERAYEEMRGLVCEDLFDKGEKKVSMRVLRKAQWLEKKENFKRLIRQVQEFE